MTPLQTLLTWVAAQNGRIHRDAYRNRAVAVGCPPPGCNSAFGTAHPMMISDGDYRALTTFGWERVRVWG